MTHHTHKHYTADTSEDLVLVTGANGFLASHIIKQLVQEGYRVRGTVRNLQKDYSDLKSVVQSPKYPLELVEADLTKPDTWAPAVRDCTYVIHTATVFPSSSWMSEDDVVKPNVDGTLAILNACAQLNSRVRRFVHTSTIAAICGDQVEDNKVYSENDWAKLEDQYSYSKSKILTEKAVWNFAKEREQSNLPCFEIAVINPGYLLGPLLINNMNESLTTVRKIMMREMPFFMLAHVCIPCCDVRDAATAHIRAMKIPAAVSHRHIVTSMYESPTLVQWAEILNKEFGDRYSISLTALPNMIVRFYSLFDSASRQKVGNLSKKIFFDNKRMTGVLMVQPIELKKTLIDTVNSMIEKNVIPRK